MFNPLLLIIFLLSISVHEWAHAAAADRLGDPTARLAGRKTLNPFAHIDLLGLVAMLLFGFGWARPVPVDPFNLKNPRRDNLLISFAGPASQIALSFFLAIIFRTLNYFLMPTSALSVVSDIIAAFIHINLLLAFFNLLPLYPLDGHGVVAGLVNEEKAKQWEQTKQYGLILLMMLILIPNQIFSISNLISLPVDFFYHLLLG